jgi:hypothetical protein
MRSRSAASGYCCYENRTHRQRGVVQVHVHVHVKVKVNVNVNVNVNVGNAAPKWREPSGTSAGRH